MSNLPSNQPICVIPELPNFDVEGFEPLFIGTSENINAIWHNADKEQAIIQFFPSKKEQELGVTGRIYIYDNFDDAVIASINNELEQDKPSIGGLLRKEVFLRAELYPCTRLY